MCGCEYELFPCDCDCILVPASDIGHGLQKCMLRLFPLEALVVLANLYVLAMSYPRLESKVVYLVGDWNVERNCGVILG